MFDFLDGIMDDEFDTSDVKPVITTAYTQLINDPSLSVELLAKALKVHKNFEVGRLRAEVERLFNKFSDITLNNELDIYNSMIAICEKMEQIEKNKALKGKAVIGIGGQFSAGKSYFINSISGIGHMLVTDQKPTTAIPTYIVRSDAEKYVLNTSDGGSVESNLTEVQALTHDFDSKYGFGFSDYLDSVFIGSPNFSLGENIALLDTPGYSKDDHTNSRDEVTDIKKAYEQLKNCDYLIWVAKMVPGITSDDIDFIRSLGIKKKILFVLNQADLESAQRARNECRKTAQKLLMESGLPCEDVALYSAKEGKEYTQNPVISSFFKKVSDYSTQKKDLIEIFEYQLNRLKDSLGEYKNKSEKTEKELHDFVQKSDNIDAIRTVAEIWDDINYERDRICGYNGWFEYEKNQIEKILKRMCAE